MGAGPHAVNRRQSRARTGQLLFSRSTAPLHGGITTACTRRPITKSLMYIARGRG